MELSQFVKCSQVFVVFCAILEFISAQRFDYDYVTCGSVLKLYNPWHSIRLHSHDVKYGSGSGQQSVTGVESADDTNSYWTVRAKNGETCERGVAIKCGQTIRLTHLATKRNLHSHHFQSPLSHNLEVSAFGDDGTGDDGDHWVIVCSQKLWRRDEKVRLKHVVSNSYLHVSGETYGRPIYGQREISAYGQANEKNYWKVSEGIFVKPTEISPDNSHIHDEF
ncbi:unnamed protein product [Owenia fusiformis]|uniref:Uncharacterized protein n=1 Tax=Owenia fusiformis TaxID=6347 RepID=A0A8J1XU88_OWEFU|nr:unnamed protein product [Owenia fusiformis]